MGKLDKWCSVYLNIKKKRRRKIRVLQNVWVISNVDEVAAPLLHLMLTYCIANTCSDDISAENHYYPSSIYDGLKSWDPFLPFVRFIGKRFSEFFFSLYIDTYSEHYLPISVYDRNIVFYGDEDIGRMCILEKSLNFSTYKHTITPPIHTQPIRLKFPLSIFVVSADTTISGDRRVVHSCTRNKEKKNNLKCFFFLIQPDFIIEGKVCIPYTYLTFCKSKAHLYLHIYAVMTWFKLDVNKIKYIGKLKAFWRLFEWIFKCVQSIKM